jgi:hypothetical protein
VGIDCVDSIALAGCSLRERCLSWRRLGAIWTKDHVQKHPGCPQRVTADDRAVVVDSIVGRQIAAFDFGQIQGSSYAKRGAVGDRSGRSG